MLYLKEITDKDEDFQIYFKFIKENNSNWKQSNIKGLKVLGVKASKQGSMSDYEYFKFLKRLGVKHGYFPTKTYILVADFQYVALFSASQINPHTMDLSCATSPKHRNKGYATKGTFLLENIIFQNPNIYFTSIKDMTINKVSSRIAHKLGYTYEPTSQSFIKFNPNLDIEALVNEKKTPLEDKKITQK